MTTILQANPYAEFERLVAIARARGRNIPQDEVDDLCFDGPEEATARIRAIVTAMGGEPVPSPDSFVRLTRQRRLAVLKRLFGENRATHDSSGLRIWTKGRGFVSAPATREALLQALPEKRPDEIDAVIASPPAVELDDWDDEDQPVVMRKAVKTTAPENDSQPAKTNPRGFVALPYYVIDHLLPAMPGAVLKVYCALLKFEGFTSGQMWPGQERLAEMTGLGRRQVCTSISILRRAGLVKSRRRWSTSNIYERVPVTDENWRDIRAALTKLCPRRRAPKKRRSKSRGRVRDCAA